MHPNRFKNKLTSAAHVAAVRVIKETCSEAYFSILAYILAKIKKKLLQ